jgi:hypothetical protein
MWITGWSVWHKTKLPAHHILCCCVTVAAGSSESLANNLCGTRPSCHLTIILCCCVTVCRRFIWITGWSVWTETLLQRTPASPTNSPSLGELLVQKANQGVTVSLLAAVV